MTLDMLAECERLAALFALLNCPFLDGNIVRYVRKHLGLTRCELGQILNCTEKVIQAWENSQSITFNQRVIFIELLLLEGLWDTI